MHSSCAPTAKRAVRPLKWIEQEAGSQRWWETAPASLGVRRAVVIWLRDLGKIAWWISEVEVTLVLGFVDSLEEPSEALLEQAKRSAAQRWWELLR